MDRSFDSDVNKGLVSLVIEETLMEMGSSDYDAVVDALKKDYNCFIPDCFNHPQYLREVLKKLYGKSDKKIINRIKEKLSEFSSNKLIMEFLRQLAENQSDVVTNDHSRQLVGLAIERVLLEMGRAELDKVKTRLKDDYNSALEDCLENPEYLKRILCDLFGDHYDDILASMRKTFTSLEINEKVENLLSVLEKK